MSRLWVVSVVFVWVSDVFSVVICVVVLVGVMGVFGIWIL